MRYLVGSLVLIFVSACGPEAKIDTLSVGRTEILEYYNNNNVRQRSEINDKGELDGLYSMYYADGSLQREGQYTDGVQEGVFFSYWDNGQCSASEQYRQGQLHGQVIYFSFSGDTTKIKHYEYGEQIN
jgi:antitoxin component YwqK of YwqJK toxin-antitoxin module